MKEWSLISCQVFSNLIRHYRRKLLYYFGKWRFQKVLNKRVPLIVSNVIREQHLLSWLVKANLLKSYLNLLSWLVKANLLKSYLNLLLLCWLGTSQHTVPLFKLLIILYFLLRGLGPRYSEGFKATSTKLGRDLGPDVKFEDLSFRLIRLTVFL